MRIFDVDLANSAKRFLRKCDKEIRERVFEGIEKLRMNPFPSDCKRVQDRKEKTFRIRVGKCRITYVVRYEFNKIEITDVDKRERVY